MKNMTFDAVKYIQLQKAYNEAVRNNLSEFIFEGELFLTAYAKYVLEYLKPKFN